MNSLLDRIRAVVADFPERIAHTGGGGDMTYRELWGRANVLAMELRRRSLARGAPVMIRGHKEPAMFVGFLGSVLAGGCYIPVDVAIPEARVERIIATAQPAAVFTVDDITSLTGAWQAAPEEPVPEAHEEDPFYIIFTSGSTGDPKGVVITHGCLRAFVDWMIGEHGFTRGTEVFVNAAPLSFDLSVMDTYLGLFTGGTIHAFTREDIASPRDFYTKVRSCNASSWVSTPSFVQMCLAEKTFNAEMMPQLRRFLFCGETLPHKTAATLLQRFPSAEVWNTYGPTEATVATTSVRVDADLLAKHDPLPIGRAMPGTRVIIRRDDGTEASDGEDGEIEIIGPNVSPGYLQRPDLTEKAFFKDEARGYRTGDRGTAQGGILFYKGRMDFQVKVHGHRIELGDVESHLRDIEGVIDAVVLPVERRGAIDSLAAFVVTKEPVAQADAFATSQAMRASLATRIPDYMIPRRIDFLESFPLTANGKADRKALAERLKERG